MSNVTMGEGDRVRERSAEVPSWRCEARELPFFALSSCDMDRFLVGMLAFDVFLFWWMD